MKKSKILLGLLIAYALNSCSLFSDPEPELPPATQIGANTLGFKVNGKNWVPKNDAKHPTFPTNIEATGGSWIDYLFSIGFSKRDANNTISGSFDIDLYDLDINKNYTKISMTLDNRWTTNKNYPWKFEITKLDTINRICAGTFSFVGLASDGSTINITDGRFDVKYRKQ
jgi:hypothetical protein